MVASIGNAKVEVGFMRDSSSLIPDPAALRQRMDEDGYLYLKGVIPTEKLRAARTRVWNLFEPAIAAAAAPLLDRQGGANADAWPRVIGGTKEQPGQVFAGGSIWHFQEPEVTGALECPELFHVFQQLFGEPALTFDFKWVRGMPAKAGTDFHMDNVYMSDGSKRLHTCWIPLMPVNLKLGGLCMLEGSHKLEGFQRIRDTYAEYNVDHTDILGGGNFSNDPVKLQAYDPRSRWVTSEQYDEGDVLIFTMKTFHGSLSNTTEDTWRLSCDVRFQPASEKVDPRWMGHNAGHTNFRNQQGRTRTMKQAKLDWGVAEPDPAFSFGK